MKKIIGGLLFGCIITSVFADAEVVDYSSSATSDTAKSFAVTPTDLSQVNVPAKTNFSIDQRINRAEQQINNINGQNLPNRLEELQQKLQKVNGELEAERHQVEQLKKQLEDFYRDVNQRLGTAKPVISQDATSTAAIPAVTPVVTNGAPNSSVVPATTANVAGVFDSSQQASNVTNTASAFLKEQQMYQTAIDLLPDKKHESENKLREYLKQYPKGIYVANAHYWLGEINYLQKNFDAAEEEFKIVVDKYSKSKKVADAALKLALVHQNQGREAEAKQELQKVIKRYPGTPAAQLAKQQLVTN